MAHFVLSHFYLSWPCIELRTAQFGETTNTFFMHVGHWLWPSRFLRGSRVRESVLASSSHFRGTAVRWGCFTGRFGDGQMLLTLCFAPGRTGLLLLCSGGTRLFLARLALHKATH